MNIIIFSWRGKGHPLAGGAEVVTFEHAKAWVKAGHQVTIFTSSFKHAKRKEIIDGVEFIRSGNQVFGVQVKAFFWYLFGKHPKIDLVIDEFHGIPFFTPIYARVRKIAFIHEVAKEVWKLNPWPKPLNYIPYIVGTIFEPFLYSLFYKKIPFVTVSKSTESDLVSFGISKENISVINNGVKIVSPKSIKKNEKITITYLGSLSLDKGVDKAIEVMAKINQQLIGCQFWVIGKGEDGLVKKLKKLAGSLGLGDNLVFWGFVSEEEKFELLAKSHILINPSIREGWGLVVIEAAAVGTPTVGFNVAGLRDSVKNGETGILCKAGDVECVAQEAVGLLSDQRKYQNMTQKSIEWSNNFSWEKSTKKSLQYIEDLNI